MSKKAILIIDDNMLIRDILYEYFFGHYDCYIFLVDSAEAAIKRMKTVQFHFIVCDYEMPMVNGDHVLTFHRENHLKGHFIFFTGLSRYEALHEKYQVDVIYEKKFIDLFNLVGKVMRDRSLS